MNKTSFHLDRRALLKLMATTAATMPFSKVAFSESYQHQPDSFLWGVATAGHQYEGNNTNADTWVLEHVSPTIFKEPSGDAVDSFTRWREDLDIARDLGLNTFRFSIEWSRIEPAKGEYSIAMLDHYRRLIAGCRERGLTPMVTFNHFTTPIWFAAAGGWETNGAADHFVRYCERVTRHMGDLLTYATTLNEPNILKVIAWLPLAFPPEFTQTQQAMLAAAAKVSGSSSFSSANVGDAEPKTAQMILGHKKGVEAIKSINPQVKVGVSLSITDDQAVGPDSKRDQKRQDVYGVWMEAARTGDFIGVQNYGRQRLDRHGAMPPPKGAEMTDSGEEFYPDSLEGAVRYAHAATGLPVIVTENGIDALDDAKRVRYIPLAVEAMQRAMRDGVPVHGYIHWSLLDNFEWLFGYGPRFGLYSVDRTTFKRTAKPSALVLAGIIKSQRAHESSASLTNSGALPT
ncbi:glycoside hydrolase family 1 protein [Paraburkholderia sp. J67]|uniref:glycoside hydrolase family 1 protein n=1 Tax=Paraburkholderia sp. J67 TaxID=2805435 RepID=UPI002ABE9B14|nr:family 1 glycosylhydrolase [Paraburkholderia sp. J67]